MPRQQDCVSSTLVQLFLLHFRKRDLWCAIPAWTLADCVYEIGTMEYPTIVASAVAPWLPSPIAEHAVS